MSTNPGLLGPYRLLNVVNTGQTTRMWQAYHDGEEKFYALKVPLDQFRRDREQVGYLKWEYMVGAKIEHERIIRMREYGVERGMAYLAMEWFAAPNMKQWIRQGYSNIAHMISKIAIQAAEAVAHFNSHGWVHRDIKPDNFLVTPEGDVKLIDFALARRASGGLARLFSPKTKVIQGTRSYMSPEQIRGVALDSRADLYSLGCTLFELLAGKPPFTGVNANDLLTKHLRSSPPSLAAANREVTPEFSELIRRTLAKKPSNRLASTEEFLSELRRVPIFKREPSPPQAAERKES